VGVAVNGRPGRPTDHVRVDLWSMLLDLVRRR